jgi:PEP-CTERM motif
MRIWYSFAVLVVAAGSLSAGPIWQESGPVSYGAFGNHETIFGWSLSTTYTGVTISFDLDEGIPADDQGTVYLTDQFGPGTTTANDIAAPYEVSGLSGGTNVVTLFSGLTLNPGDYYLVFAPADPGEPPGGAMGFDGTYSPTQTLGTGVTLLGWGGSAATSGDGLPPDVSESLNPYPSSESDVFSITGTPSSTTPEPGTGLMFLAGGGVLFAGLRRKR